MNPYAVLGVEKDATAVEIKIAFRRRSKETHPDAGGSAEAFAEVTKANDVLSDPERRRRFDETGEIEDPDINDPDAMAWSIIAQCFEAALTSPQDITDQDMIAGMRNGINRVISEINQKIRLIEQEISRAVKMQKRFKRKAGVGGADVIQNMLASRARRTNEILEQAMAQRRDNERAKAILDDYDYEHQPFTHQGGLRQGVHYPYGPRCNRHHRS